MLHLMINGIQVKMARAALGWKASDLAHKAGVTGNTIFRLEAGKGVQASTLAAIQRALEEGGVRFVEVDGEVGVLMPTSYLS